MTLLSIINNYLDLVTCNDNANINSNKYENVIIIMIIIISAEKSQEMDFTFKEVSQN